MAKVIFVDDNGNQKVLKEGNLTERDVFFKQDYFAMKRWSREDISGILEEELAGECDITDEDWESLIDAVVDKGADWKALEDCCDFEWDTIRDNVKAVLKQMGTAEITDIEWDTEDNEDPGDPDELELPRSVKLKNAYPWVDIADLLSDEYGYCVKSFKENR